MTLLHAHAQYIFIACAKYQEALVKAMVQIDFLIAFVQIPGLPTSQINIYI